jgi:DUF1009 family protein
MGPPSSSSRSTVNSEISRINRDFISVGQALKLVPPFKENKQEVLAFIGNVDTAYTVINPRQETMLYKFMLQCKNGNHRNLNNWVELIIKLLQNTYGEK